jgi:putative acetyltransferase
MIICDLGQGTAKLAPQASQSAELNLRVVTDADFPSLSDLWVASWREAMPGIDFEARRRWLIDHLRALQTAGSFIICAFDRSDRLLGVTTIDPATGYLDQLAVAPEAKGKGVARLLLGEARRLSPSGITLEVNEDNARAIAFYEREGFVKIADGGVNPNSGLNTRRLRWPGRGGVNSTGP